VAPPSANRSYMTPGPRLLQAITKLHIRLYEKTGGALGSVVFQLGEKGTSLLRRMDVLVLTTRGRKSGERRKVTLPFFQYDDRIFVIASNAASEKHPAWYLNLTSNPDVTVTLGPATLRARARPLEGGEYDTFWHRHTAEWPRWRLYQEQTSRKIPMVELVLGR
jgi:deazaflavin-dependent oxidoreductase (nitroreductase family)